MSFCPRCQREHPEHRVCPVHGLALADAADLERLGQKIGAYELTAILGRGGMATVYRAESEDETRPSAIKILHPRFSRPAGEILQGVAALVGLDHPGWVAVHEAGFEPRIGVFFRLDFVAGPTLGDVLHEDGPLTPPVARALVERVAAALEALHGAGHLHRDLKPDNLLLAEGDPQAVRLLDLPDAAVAEALLARGIVQGNFGTPQYMAPEVARGERADARSDLYALGLLWWETVTGRRPFDGDDPAEILRAQVEDDPPPPPELPEPHAELLRALLQKSPEDRPASAEALLSSLADPSSEP